MKVNLLWEVEYSNITKQEGWTIWLIKYEHIQEVLRTGVSSSQVYGLDLF